MAGSFSYELGDGFLVLDGIFNLERLIVGTIDCYTTWSFGSADSKALKDFV